MNERYDGRMSQREDLLQGAKQCIAEKGYSRTTARDISAASGANLASIGYHFGSKEALLNAAVLESFDEWGEAVESAMVGVEDASPAERLENFLVRFAESLPQRSAWVVSSLQAFAEAEYAPEIKEQLNESMKEGRRSLASMVLGVAPEEVGPEDLPLGVLLLSLINGYVLQWFVSPATAPPASDLAAAIRRLGRPE